MPRVHMDRNVVNLLPNCHSVHKNELRLPGVEPGSIAWKAIILTVGLQTQHEPDVNRTRNLLIWSQTRYHCATDPMACLPTTKRGCGTRTSREVTHPSTVLAQARLTAEF